MANAAPAHILGIQLTNPPAPGPQAATDSRYFGNDGANIIATGKPSGGDAFPSVDAQQEWKQVFAPDDDYESELVGASGWVLNNEFSTADVPFDHPFQFDWEFMLSPDSQYAPLLARGNQVPEEDDEIINRARTLQVPLVFGPQDIPSLLGVEIDGGLVPKTFADGVSEGDRAAIFGRWIVDCGHAVKVAVPESLPDSFRSEIHPPLIMATAKVANGSIASGSPVGSEVTRVLFTSRPFLVGQRFGTETGSLYDDNAGDDGPFVPHLSNEVSKVNETLLGIPLASTMVEAHPKIKSYPFKGAYLAHFIVRPPTLATVHHGPVDPLLRPHVAVSFQFTVRSGCAVEITSSGPDVIDVFIAMNSAGYTSPPLPNRDERVWTKDDLNNLNSSSGSAITGIEIGSALLQAISVIRGGVINIPTVLEILSRGIKTDEYDCGPLVSVNTLDHSHFVGSPADNIPQGKGVIQDDSQPYPVFGWIEVGWVKPEMSSH